MRDYIVIGSSPIDEQCAQVGSDGYDELATLECSAYIKQLRRVFPDAKCAFRRKSFNHDFGTYYEVVAVYDDDDELATRDAFLAEAESPEKWDAIAKDELEALTNPAPFTVGDLLRKKTLRRL